VVEHLSVFCRVGFFCLGCEGENDMLGTILIVVLILMLLGMLPTWPHSRNWGYGPSGGLGLVVLILLILLLLGYL
jgi:hypothetical protein